MVDFPQGPRFDFLLNCQTSRFLDRQAKNFGMLLGVALLVLLVFIAALWSFLWKFILEPNPIVRDFFDLDRKETKPKKSS